MHRQCLGTPHSQRTRYYIRHSWHRPLPPIRFQSLALPRHLCRPPLPIFHRWPRSHSGCPVDPYHAILGPQQTRTRPFFTLICPPSASCLVRIICPPIRLCYGQRQASRMDFRVCALSFPVSPGTYDICRFTGSAGQAIVSKTAAYLITDSCYWFKLQAWDELDLNWHLITTASGAVDGPKDWTDWLIVSLTSLILCLSKSYGSSIRIVPRMRTLV
jgi:hypothetical protein